MPNLCSSSTTKSPVFEKLIPDVNRACVPINISTSPLLNELTWSDLIGYKFFINKTKKIFNRILSPKELFYLAEKNNLDALSIWREYGKSIGLCLSHIIGILNPNHITIGGGISRANKYFHKEIINSIKKYCIIYNSDNLKFHYDTDNLNIYYGGLRLNHNNI